VGPPRVARGAGLRLALEHRAELAGGRRAGGSGRAEWG